MSGPLEGVNMLDVGTAGVGPWAATLLGYLGAPWWGVWEHAPIVASPRRGQYNGEILAFSKAASD